jgi:hypothetical protein
VSLVEALLAAGVLALASPALVSAVNPLMELRRETLTLREEVAANRFVAEGFRALPERLRPDSAEDFGPWQALSESLTGITVTVTKVRESGRVRVYRAAWTYENKPLFVEAEFKF